MNYLQWRRLSRPAAARPVVIALFGLSLAQTALGAPPAAPSATRQGLIDAYGKLPLSFEVNRGQTDREVKFLTRGGGYTLFLTAREAVLSLGPTPQSAGHVLRMRLAGSGGQARAEGLEPLPGKINYYLGKDSRRWLEGVATYAKVRYENVYPGIDLLYYGAQGRLEYDFVVKPGADPGLIRLEFDGTDSLEVDGNGDLSLVVPGREVRFRKPVVHQAGRGGLHEIAGRYVRTGEREAGFRVGAYDPTRPLVIDPVLLYSTYLGGSAGESGQGIAVDSSGAAIVGGYTDSLDFPTTGGAYQGVSRGVPVFKTTTAGNTWNPSSSGISLSYGGMSALAVDPVAPSVVYTASSRRVFKSTDGGANWAATAFSSSISSLSSLAINPANTSILYAGNYLGIWKTADAGGAWTPVVSGLTNKSVAALAIDPATPTTVYAATAGGGVFRSDNAAGSWMAVNSGLTRLNVQCLAIHPHTSTTVFAGTYTGGVFKSADRGQNWVAKNSGLGDLEVQALAMDRQNPPVLYAGTSHGVYKSLDLGETWLNASGGWPNWYVSSLVADPSTPGVAYANISRNGIFKTTNGGTSWAAVNNGVTNFDILALALNPANPAVLYAGTLAGSDAFVTKFDPSGSNLIYSTYLGGAGQDRGQAVAADPAGSAYLTGDTRSLDFPTLNAMQPAHGGGPNLGDAFVAKLTPSGTLAYSTYLGGSCDDAGKAVAADTGGNAYVTGSTGNCAPYNFPLLNPFQPVAGGGGADAFVSRFSSAGALVYSTFLGGASWDSGAGIAVNAAGEAHVAGITGSANFPTTANALQSALGGSGDAFLVKLNQPGNGALYSTYYGGASSDEARAIALDSAGKAYLAGTTQSSNLPTKNPLQPGLAGATDAFVAKLDPFQTGAASLAYATYLGGSSGDQGLAVGVDASGNIHVAGLAGAGFPVVNPIQCPSTSGSSFLAKIDPSSPALVFSSFLPGYAYGVAVDGSGNAYVTGYTDWIPPVNAFQGALGGGVYDAFVAKVGELPPTDLMVVKGDAPDPVGVNSNLNYVVTVSNSGPPTGRCVTMTDTLPAGVTFLSAVATPGSCSHASGVVTCTLGDLAPGGTGNITITVRTDGAGTITNTATVTSAGPDSNPANNTATAQTTVGLDSTPPVIVPTVNPPPNAAGWNRSDVTVTWSVSDPESGIASSSGCGTTNLTVETAGATLTCTATNGAGLSKSVSVTVKIDKTAPTLTFAPQDPPANAAGWNRSDVSFTFAVADSLSGVESSSPPSPLVLTSEGTAVTGTVTLVDRAGNTSVYASHAVRIDKTAPTLAFGTPAPAPNAAGWNNTNVSIGYTAADALSGVDQATPASPLALTAEGAAVTGSVTVTDRAGNSASFTSPAVKIDKTAPTLAFGTPAPAPNGAGWNNTNVSMAYTAADALSGVASATPISPLALTAEGAAVTGSVTVTDRAGNSASFTSPAVKIDKTRPTLTFSGPTPAPNGAGWNNTDVSIGYTAADALSGVESATPISPLALTAEGAAVTGTVTVTDRAGNGASFTSPAVRIDKTAPTMTGSRSPAPNANGWNNSDVTVTFTCSDSLSNLAPGSPPAPTVVSAEGSNQSVNGACQDLAGNTASATVGGISIDKTAPTATANTTPSANANGWNNSNVTVSFAGADALSGISGCSTPAVLSSEGTNQGATGTCTDNAGNVSAPATASGINIDKTAPTLAFGTPAPAPNAAGWNNTNVSIGYTAADALSGVESATPISPLALTAEGVAVTGAVTVTDRAGNGASFTSPALKIDKTSPSISGSRSPGPNANGWNNGDVTVTFTCSDSLSNLAPGSPPTPTVVSTEGGSQSVNGACQDLAGNTASATVGGISVDKTAPTATGSASPPPNPYGWNRTDVIVSFTGSDTLSGISGCSTSAVLSSEGANQGATGTCSDKADNVSAPATASGINIDKTTPTLAFGTPAPAPNGAGWNNTNVSIGYTAADALSGVDQATPVSPLALTAEGTAVTGTVTVTDKAGNGASFTSPAVKIDKTAPLVSAAVSPAPNAHGWNNSDVTVGFSALDGLSSVKVVSSAVTVTTEGKDQVVPGWATDYADNKAAISVSVNLDKTAPLTSDVAPTPNPGPVNAAIVFTASVNRSTAGASNIAAAQYSIDDGAWVAMSAADGSFDAPSETVTAPLAVFSTPGVHEVCVRGADLAGNAGSTSCILLAVYDPNGGFVTGGGWIMSPAGAYADNPALTGKANFGFVSKYQPGANQPTGETQFQFKAASLNFHSSSYDWLVVAGARAQFKGVGTINGSGQYSFLLTAIDGQVSGGHGVDRFRIKIWNEAGGGVVYDNQMGKDETGDDATELGGGSIIIHKQ